MTSINAIRFNDYSGAMIFDEFRCWNPEWMIIPSAHKIKSVVDEDISLATGLVAAYGNTGTSAIGEELRSSIRKKVRKRWQEYIEEHGKKPSHLLTVADLAELVYNLMCEVKHKHTDELLYGKYGFKTDDFIQGSYSYKNKTYNIENKDIVKLVNETITYKDMAESASPVFGNAGIIAGFEPHEKFRIFYFSIMEQVCEPVQEIFVSAGSGSDQCQWILGDFAAHNNTPEQRSNIMPAEGLYAAIEAIVIASRRNIGVGGYAHILLFDGKNEQSKMKMIVDDRARLATEIAKAHIGKFIEKEEAISLIEDLCFKGKSWEDVNESLFAKSHHTHKLKLYLRGYGYKG